MGREGRIVIVMFRLIEELLTSILGICCALASITEPRTLT